MTKKERKGKGKRVESFDLLGITESLGYQIHRKSGRNSWSKDEDKELMDLMNTALIQMGYADGIDSLKTFRDSVEATKKISWDALSQRFRNSLRTAKDLKKRWTGSLDPNLKKGRWTKEEDERLIQSYEKFGAHWLSVSLDIEGRTEDQCAKRYIEVLGPGSKGRLRTWTLEEDLSLISKVKAYGTKWRKISSEMEFRPSLTCRNRWRKIITMVVRGQAHEQISTAVKENKNIDLTQLSKENASKKKTNEPETPVADGIMKEESVDNPEKTSILDKLDASAIPTSTNQVRHPLSTIKQLPSLSELTPSPGFLEGMSHQVQNDNIRPITGHTKTLEDSLSPLVRATGLILDSATHMNNYPQRQQVGTTPEYHPTENTKPTLTNIPQAKTSVPNNGTPQPIISSPAVPLHTQTEWKFTLKDRKGLSISNGAINNSELVRELIDQARKYSLKISVHQHIHNHYGVSNLRNNGKVSEGSVYNQNNSTTSSSNSNGLSPASIIELYRNPNMVKSTASLPTDIVHQFGVNQETNFQIHDSMRHSDVNLNKQRTADDMNFLTKSQTLNYPSLEFGGSPMIENKNLNDHLYYPHIKTVSRPAILTAGSAGSNSAMNSPHLSNVGMTHNKISPNSLKSDGSSSIAHTTPGSHGTLKSQTSDIPDVGPSRFSHFNYLPPTIRPQLGSSETGGADLNKILNPSPLSSGTNRRKRSFGSKHKHSKLRKKSRSSGSAENDKLKSDKKKDSNSRRSSKSQVDYSSEDGVDFWENLRSLDRHGINAESSNSSSGVGTSPNEDLPPSEEEDDNDPFYYLNPS